jgi:histidyl-tRNA synthetase
MFDLGAGASLMPEVTNYIRSAGALRLGAGKVYYVARCFRDETTTDSERLREFTQIGVEMLGENALDCRKVVRSDAIGLFKKLFTNSESWQLEDGVARGLNLYDSSGKTFEIVSPLNRKQLLGGGPYDGGAGWALGVERLMIALSK